MTANLQKAGTDLDSIFAPTHAGWPTAATTNVQSGGIDLNSRYATLASGSAAAITNIKANGTDLSSLFAAIGTTSVAVTGILAVSQTAAAGNPSGSMTSNTGGTSAGSNTVTASKGKQSGYTYTWTIATGAGISFPGQGTPSTTVSATVNAGTTNSGTFYCAVSDGTTTTNTNTVAWTLQNTSVSGVNFTVTSGHVSGISGGTATGDGFCSQTSVVYVGSPAFGSVSPPGYQPHATNFPILQLFYYTNTSPAQKTIIVEFTGNPGLPSGTTGVTINAVKYTSTSPGFSFSTPGGNLRMTWTGPASNPFVGVVNVNMDF